MFDVTNIQSLTELTFSCVISISVLIPVIAFSLGQEICTLFGCNTDETFQCKVQELDGLTCDMSSTAVEQYS